MGAPDLPVLLIVDECQALQDNKSQRHQRVRLMRRKCDRVIGLSGTPTGGTPFALYHMLNALGCCPWTWPVFLRRYNAFELPHGGYDFARRKDGSIDVDPRVPEELSRVLRRRLRKDVAADLPPKIYRDRYIPHKRATTAALKEIEAEMAPYYETGRSAGARRLCAC